MKFTGLAFLGALAATATAQGVPRPVRGPNTLVFKEIGGVPNNECLTFTNDGTIVNAACAWTHADRQVAPAKIMGTDVLVVQRGWLQPFRPDLVGKTACIAFNGQTFRAEDCGRSDLLFVRYDIGSGRMLANGHTACLSGHDNRAIVTVDTSGQRCAQFTITAVTPTPP
ncbi:hypothetical protein VTJ49DRAFT_4205 [Mycothermus thermophilus]|uniref:Uncharacterized protein n=1 Tax=Humicola insolens TaxID=85995 RepID=A0ABR3V5W8_HUMIN